MIEIIKNDLIHYETITIPDGVQILERLKENTRFEFTLKRVSIPEFDRIKKAQETDQLLDHLVTCPIVGYNPFVKGDNAFQSSGGLKLSSDQKEVLDSFVIEEDRIIYTPVVKFYEERDCFVYSRRDFYTTISMPEILEQELHFNRECLVYRGEELKDLRFRPIFDSLTCDEMMEYATNPAKGEEAYQKIYRK